jgi:uncharacterized protein
MMAGIAVGVAVPIMLLVTLAVAVVATVLLRCCYRAKPPQEKHCCSTMELHQMVNKVYTNSIYMTNANHITLHRQTWLSA